MNNTHENANAFNEALQKAQTWMDEIEGVAGVAEGSCDGERCITVWVTIQDAIEQLPTTLDGFQVIAEMSEPFRSMPF